MVIICQRHQLIAYLQPSFNKAFPSLIFFSSSYSIIHTEKIIFNPLSKTMIICLVFIAQISYAQKSSTTLPYGLQLMGNNEQVSFCVPIPVKEYNEISSDQRAKKLFVNKKNKKYQLILQGLFRSDTTVSIENYFTNSYATAEEEGKIIEKKELLKNNNCFYATGYWNNAYYSSRFIEITWLRKDELVKFEVNYPVADSVIWKNRLQTICGFSSVCE